MEKRQRREVKKMATTMTTTVTRPCDHQEVYRVPAMGFARLMVWRV